MQTKILAHRGYSQIAPENTQLAFDAAYLFGFDGIEVDLHLSKDQKLVVIHDEDVQRTANGSGKVMNLTLAQLRKLNFASQFGAEYPHQKIMTYEELLIKYGDKFKIINVEIKTDIIHYQGIEKLIWNVHQKVKPKAQIIYSSFNFDSLVMMNHISKSAILGFLFVEPKDCEGKEAEIKKICQYIHPWFKSLLQKESMDFYKQLNLPMNLWTFDQRETMDKWTNGSHQNFNKILKMKNIYSIISNSKY